MPLALYISQPTKFDPEVLKKLRSKKMEVEKNESERI